MTTLDVFSVHQMNALNLVLYTVNEQDVSRDVNIWSYSDSSHKDSGSQWLALLSLDSPVLTNTLSGCHTTCRPQTSLLGAMSHRYMDSYL